MEHLELQSAAVLQSVTSCHAHTYMHCAMLSLPLLRLPLIWVYERRHTLLRTLPWALLTGAAVQADEEGRVVHLGVRDEVLRDGSSVNVEDVGSTPVVPDKDSVHA